MLCNIHTNSCRAHSYKHFKDVINVLSKFCLHVAMEILNSLEIPSIVLKALLCRGLGQGVARLSVYAFYQKNDFMFCVFINRSLHSRLQCLHTTGCDVCTTCCEFRYIIVLLFIETLAEFQRRKLCFKLMFYSC